LFCYFEIEITSTELILRVIL